MKDSLIIHSSVSTYALKMRLLKGCTIASLGIAILVLSGIYLPIESLHKWGGGLFFTSIGLITLGMLPYRRLAKLQLRPDELIFLESDHVTFYHFGKKILTIPFESIKEISYFSHVRLYGIVMSIKSPFDGAIKMEGKGKNSVKMSQIKEKKKKNELFFPYFNRRAYEELLDWQSKKKNLISDEACSQGD
ncbi:MAG: hypothetical protein ACH350_04250 [Parachlamydiaceae bacterium]